MEWNIGCSGFSYREWKGIFYPDKLAQTKWFAFYADHFDTLELNVTFYRFPKVPMLNGWYEKSPQGFTFAVKAPQLITHFKQLLDSKDLLNDFYATCNEGLKEKLGPLLFQFPPKFIYTEEHLERIIKSLDNSFINVVEFRHKSWWHEEVYTQLKKHGIIFCGISHPTLPDEVIINSPNVYYRFHGVPKLYYGEYENAFLKTVADTILKSPVSKKVYCLFNNTASVAAIKNAKWLHEYCSTKK